MTQWNQPGAGGQDGASQNPPWTAQPSYGEQGGGQPAWGAKQPTHGSGQPGYDTGQSSYGSGQPPYGPPVYGGAGATAYGQPGSGYGAPAYPQYGAGPSGYGGQGPIGQIRGTGLTIFLTIITLGIYAWFWYYQVHAEMKRHSGQGLDGPVALILAIFVGIIMPFLTSGEVANLYDRQGRPKPVSAATGLWYFPGALILVGPIVWFVKTNGALNTYWRSLGAQG